MNSLGHRSETCKPTTNFLSVYTVQSYDSLMALEMAEQIQPNKDLVCGDPAVFSQARDALSDQMHPVNKALRSHSFWFLLIWAFWVMTS